MDRSLDSIGSCSLDVDADSSDITDTSSSLNFPTPLSVKDVTLEFTANIRERCIVRPVQHSTTTTSTATAYLDPTSGQVCMVLTQPKPVVAGFSAAATHITTAAADGSVGYPKATTKASQQTVTVVDVDVTVVDAAAYDKKPSYLNLACCVNGYSNLTTYDSKIRQDINKSREVSPIRPSTNSLQYCKKNNSLAAPVLHMMPNVSLNATTTAMTTTSPLTKQSAAVANKYTLIEANNNGGTKPNLENGIATEHNHNGATSKTSFIQQRVERLYGPGALAQGFYSPKKHPSTRTYSTSPATLERQQSANELTRKFKQLSPSKDYSEFRKKLDHNASAAASTRQAHTELITDNGAVCNGDVELPVFRHLSQEFRAQLPTVSPKRNATRISPAKELLGAAVNGNGNGKSNGNSVHTALTDEVDHKVLVTKVGPELDIEEFLTTTTIIMKAPSVESATSKLPSTVTSSAAAYCAGAGDGAEKDGNHFLIELKSEQTRLLALAAEAEKYIDALSNNPEITEDTLGFLRSAAGKARLLVSQKMKQFEGLCHNNLNRSPEDKFPTTVDDLQGFWDMVNLQVEHVDSIFADVRKLKSNDWKRIAEPSAINSLPLKSQKTVKTGNLKPKSSLGVAVNATANSVKSDAAKSAAAVKREAQRKLLLEMKRKNREAIAAASATSTGKDALIGDNKIATEQSS